MKKIKVRIAELAGCDYCRSEEEVTYREGIYANLSIITLGSRKLIKTSPKICPPFRKCWGEKSPQQAFVINYCPNCGRKLNKKG